MTGFILFWLNEHKLNIFLKPLTAKEESLTKNSGEEVMDSPLSCLCICVVLPAGISLPEILEHIMQLVFFQTCINYLRIQFFISLLNFMCMC